MTLEFLGGLLPTDFLELVGGIKFCPCFSLLRGYPDSHPHAPSGLDRRKAALKHPSLLEMRKLLCTKLKATLKTFFYELPWSLGWTQKPLKNVTKFLLLWSKNLPILYKVSMDKYEWLFSDIL